ncbi:MOSC domain-containing protein [Sphingorhabdus sp.]|jgi:MOSC domain-containing protein YiiM|uniref:MOSC domain-containing protein n=1 Tax=Sphingorhabdus sp. TaxID=1902408 RepID=UPI003BB06AB1|nr:MOSC domain-containing protein [Sphingomonadales bacterium]MBK9433447.1 MOSC domain-containing protein [Sphingomonadales bacterium]MBL0020916.1 MOSC domain-containing protein [Sphingomonadales bacterium]
MIQTHLDALLVGTPRRLRDDGTDSTIAARKVVDAPVKLSQTGFEGDRVADPSVHGGIDKAVHFYPTEHYPAWRSDFCGGVVGNAELLGRLGAFGENLAAAGMTEDTVHIGDRFRIGTALVEISQGRQPCWKVDHHFQSKQVMAMMITSGRSGYYFRVIEEGVVDPGAAIQQVESGAAEWSVARTFQLLIGGGHKAANADAALRDLSALSTLAENWRARALRLLG